MTRTLAIIAILTLFGMSPGSSASGQIRTHYRGAARSASDPHSPGTLEWSVFAQTDSQSTGWLAIGPPLIGSGLTAAFKGKDTTLLVTASASGDTIVWYSPNNGDALGGEYRIVAGQYAGQQGEWSLTPDPVMPDSLRVLAALAVAAILLAGIYFLARRYSPGYWRGRLASPANFSDEQVRNWDEIGGWLAFFFFGGVVTIIWLLATIGEVGSTIGSGMWMLAAPVPAFRYTLFLEATAQLLQLGGTVIGLFLIYRKSPLAPLFWVFLLITALVYSLYDIIAASNFKSQLETSLGTSLGAETETEMSTAAGRNSRLVVNAILWSLYWVSSKRVRVRFAPRVPEVTTLEGSEASPITPPENAQPTE
jgi:hypothetical protein